MKKNKPEHIDDFVPIDYTRLEQIGWDKKLSRTQLSTIGLFGSLKHYNQCRERNDPITIFALFELSFKLGINKEWLTGTSDIKEDISKKTFCVPDRIFFSL
jgi:hypothetical protein